MKEPTIIGLCAVVLALALGLTLCSCGLSGSITLNPDGTTSISVVPPAPTSDK